MLEPPSSASFEDVMSLDGLPFIRSLLAYEEERFDRTFIADSVYEDMNADFGIFPRAKVYPLYFAGDIRQPEDKIIFIGINPGYSEKENAAEQTYLEEKGSFEGYCDLFTWRASIKKQSRYFTSIGGFLRRIGWLDEKISWPWLAEHFINMDLIPYHSMNTSGLRINDLARYKERYFLPLVKILDYLAPTRPVFITGYPTFEPYFADPLFANLIEVKKDDCIWIGTIAGKHRFFGLPFLNRPIGGKDRIASAVLRHLDPERVDPAH